MSDTFKKEPKRRRVFNILIVVFIAIVGVPLTVYATMKAIEYFTKAGPTAEPKRIEVTNITDSQATISWTTPDADTSGLVKYGSSTDLNEFAQDVRDEGNDVNLDTIHYVNLGQLAPNTKYYYILIIGDKEYDNNGQPYDFKTGPTLETLSTPNPLVGETKNPFDTEKDLIVYMYLQKDGAMSNKLSVLVTGDSYSLDFSNLRVADLSDTFIDLNGATLVLMGDSGSTGVGSVVTEIIEL